MPATPNERYNSGGVPHGAPFVAVYAPTDPSNPNGGATKIGTYRCESLMPKQDSTLTKRPDVDAGQNGWFIVDGDIEGSAVLQRNTAATPTLQSGWYFDAYGRVDVDGTPVGERFVIHGADAPQDAGYRKMSVSVIVDQSATGVSPVDPLTGD